MPEDMPDHMPEDMPDRMPNRMSEDMSDRMPEDLPVRKCINVMVGITRSKVIFFSWLFQFPSAFAHQWPQFWPFSSCKSVSQPIHGMITPFILAGGLEHFLLLYIYIYILGIIIPTDFHIFQRGRSTTNQYIFIAIDVLFPLVG